MPKVPTYTIGQQSLRPLEGEQRINVPEGAFGGLAGKALEGAGKSMGTAVDIYAKVQQQLLERTEDATILKFENDLADQIRLGLYEKDPNTSGTPGTNKAPTAPQRKYGFTHLRGESALNEQSNYQKSFKKFADSIGNDLTARGRAKWLAIKQSRLQSANNTLASHAVRELRVYEDEMYKESIESSAADAISFGTDFEPATIESVTSEMAAGRAILKEQSRLHGWSTAVLEAKLKAYDSGVHEGIINNFLAEDQPSLAEQYLKRVVKSDGTTVKDQILENNKPAIVAKIKSRTLQARSKRLVEEIVVDVNDPTPSMTLKEARTRIREQLTKPDQLPLLQATLTRLEKVYSDVSANLAAEEQAAWAQLNKVQDFSQLTPDEQYLIETRSPTALHSWLKTRGAVFADRDVYPQLQELISEAQRGNRKAFETLRNTILERDYGGKLTDAHMDSARKSIKALMDTGSTQLIGNYTADVKHTLQSMFGKSSEAKWTKKQLKFRNWFRAEMNQWSEDFKDQNGSWPTTEEVSKKLFSLSETVSVERDWGLDPKVELDDLPLADVDDIKALLKSADPKKDPTAKEIIHAYYYLQDSDKKEAEKRKTLRNRYKDKNKEIFKAKAMLADD
jgi:hypothetical protein